MADDNFDFDIDLCIHSVLDICFCETEKNSKQFLLGPSARYEIRFHKVKEKRTRYHPLTLSMGKRWTGRREGFWLKSVPTSHDSLSINGKKAPMKLMRNVNEKHDLDHKNRTRENVSTSFPKSTLTENPTIAHERKGILFPRGDARRVKKYLKELD